jgi:hypothetical protein
MWEFGCKLFILMAYPVLISFVRHLEIFIGITAACVPCLKAMFERILRRGEFSSLNGSQNATIRTQDFQSSSIGMDKINTGSTNRSQRKPQTILSTNEEEDQKMVTYWEALDLKT